MQRSHEKVGVGGRDEQKQEENGERDWVGNEEGEENPVKSRGVGRCSPARATEKDDVGTSNDEEGESDLFCLGSRTFGNETKLESLSPGRIGRGCTMWVICGSYESVRFEGGLRVSCERERKERKTGMEEGASRGLRTKENSEMQPPPWHFCLDQSSELFLVGNTYHPSLRASERT